nr:hypothetical protein [uncultured Pseudomonas sp.]
MSDQIISQLCSLLSSAWEVVNSAFVIAFIGGLTGAFGGALGAQHIVERSKNREELLRELRNTNAAIMVSFTISNVVLALKKQHVQPMYESFMTEKERLRKFQEEPSTQKSHEKRQYHLTADLRSFPAPITPIETLQELLFHKISAHGRPLALAAVLEQSLIGLKDSITKRDSLAQKFGNGEIPNELMAQHYFGLPLPNNDINQEYPDLVEAIHSYSDDIIFFSTLLCADLVEHGKRIHKVFTKKFGNNAPNVSTADFASPRKSGLIPSESQYIDWLNGFREHNVSK